MRRLTRLIAMLVTEADAPVDPPAALDLPAATDPAPDPPVVDTPAVDPPAPHAAPEVAVRTGRAGDPASATEVVTPVTVVPPTADVRVPLPPPPVVRTPPAPERPRDARRGDDPAPSDAAPDDSAGDSAGEAVPSPADTLPLPRPRSSAVTAHTVVAGDNLWDLAAARIAEASGRTADQLTNADVVVYWVRMCEANRPRLRSGDPSLIFPGEVIDLPPV